ncbi:hypothetical protein BKA64DRAFT_761118 [Cadophora sp. MPI-SDFR-AT-0126]|nr:hypothetical protein BKA64DRAFT_761118 [Leotiomycetes sp. MPI-SDFR-AT-0126]
MSPLDRPLKVGLLNTKPNFKIDQDPLERKKLKAMEADDRARAIVRRANFYIQMQPHSWAISGAFKKAYDEAKAKDKVSFTKPTELIVMPSKWEPHLIRSQLAHLLFLRKVEPWFPFSDKELSTSKDHEDARIKHWPTAAPIISHMGKFWRDSENQFCVSGLWS